VDRDRRARERRWAVEPGDQAALASAIAARRRAGQPVPGWLRERVVRPGRTFASRLRLEVWALLPSGATRPVGRTGPGAEPVAVPPHRAWWVKPARSIRRRRLLSEVAAQGVPGLSLARCRLDRAQLALLAECRTLEWLSLARTRGYRPRDLAALAGLERLRHLDLAGAPVDASALEALRPLAGLASLGLAGVRLERADLGALGGLAGLGALDLAGARLDPGGLGALGDLGALSRLDLSGASGAAVGRDLAGLGRLEHLVALGLADLGDLRGGALAHLAGLPRLRRLDLSGAAALADEDLAHLAALPALEDLALARCRGLGGRGGLARLARLPGLRRLDLSHGRLRDGDLAALPRLAGLTHLALAQDGYGRRRLGDAAADLATALGGLVHLELPGSVSAAAVRRLAALPGLRRLGLEHAALDRGLVAAAAALPGLAELSFGYAHPDDRSAGWPAELAAAPELVRLDLEHVQLGPEDLAALGRLERLERLNLAHALPGAEGAAAPALLAGLGGLRALDLSGCPRVGADPAALAALARAGGLAELRLGGTAVTPAQRDALAADLPRGRVSLAYRVRDYFARALDWRRPAVAPDPLDPPGVASRRPA